MTQYRESEMSSVEAQLVSLYGEREHLERELGMSEATAIVEMVRSLEAQLRDLYCDREHGRSSDAEPSQHASLELQLIDLYAQREALTKAIGSADAEEVTAMVHSLEHQLRDLYREKESGAATAAAVAAQMQGIANQLSGDYRQAELTYAAEPEAGRWQITWKSG